MFVQKHLVLFGVRPLMLGTALLTLLALFPSSGKGDVLEPPIQRKKGHAVNVDRINNFIERCHPRPRVTIYYRETKRIELTIPSELSAQAERFGLSESTEPPPSRFFEISCALAGLSLSLCCMTAGIFFIRRTGRLWLVGLIAGFAVVLIIIMSAAAIVAKIMIKDEPGDDGRVVVTISDADTRIRLILPVEFNPSGRVEEENWPPSRRPRQRDRFEDKKPPGEKQGDK